MQERIRRVDAGAAEYSEFAYIMKQNQPAILHGFAGLLPYFLPWQSEGRADVDFLRRELGHMVVPVVECSRGGYGQQQQSLMTLSEYLDKVRDGRQTQEGGGSEGDQAPEQRGLGSSSSGGDGDNGGDSGGNGGGSLFYLKDWHFQRKRRDGRGERTSNNTGGAGGGSGSAEAAETPFFGGGGSGSAEAAETPFFFADDWLNWWCDAQGKDDYRFVYIGPSGTWTPLHHDVLNSYSWSYNVCGSKHWTLFPPEATPDLYARHGQELAPDVRSGHADPDEFPRLEGAPRLEVLQGPGEAIFVPSGWHHQVVNMGDGSPHGGLTISVNTNWFNGFNLARVHAFLLSELSAVRDALEHLREDMNDDRRRCPTVPIGVSSGRDGSGRGSSSGRGSGGFSSSDRGGSSGGSGGRKREWERQCEVVMRANSALNVTEFARIVTARAQHLLSLNSLGDPSAAPAPCPPSGAAAPSRGTTGYNSENGAREAMEPMAEEGRGNSRCGGGSGGESCGGGRWGGAWREERWKVFALEQIRVVLQDLMIFPCADHVFLGDGNRRDDGIDGTDGTAGTDGAPGEGICGTPAEGSGDRRGDELRETLESVEAYLVSRG